MSHIRTPGEINRLYPHITGAVMNWGLYRGQGSRCAGGRDTFNPPASEEHASEEHASEEHASKLPAFHHIWRGGYTVPSWDSDPISEK